MAMRRVLWGMGIAVALGAGLALALALVSLGGPAEGVAGGERVGVVEVRGFIADPRPAVDALRAFREDPEVKAVVLRVETPGGGVSPSQEIHDEVRRTVAEKPVVASFGALAASGGYYLSAPATRIYANPGTATGSIGVILQFQEIHLLFDRFGLRGRVVKSGPLKDAGSPLREMTEEDRAAFQSLIDDLFAQFVEAVAEGRGLERAAVLALADGRVYSGRQAKELKLVDELGGFWDAVGAAWELAGLEGKPRLEYRRRRARSALRWFLGEDADAWAPLEAAGAPFPRYAMPAW